MEVVEGVSADGGRSSAAPVDVAAGTVIAERYRIESPIGEGGFGAVYRATNLPTGEVVAVKMLHARHLGRETEVKRFQREAALVTRLDHPNIVKTLDYGHTGDGAPFIVFELLAGLSLREKLRAEGALSITRAGRVTVQVLLALEQAHALSIVHRDIKPANIFLVAGRDDDFVRVLDFGVAKALTPDSANLTKLTATGTFIGTPAYMAPEQIKGAAIGPSADLYSLGLVLSELITGKKVVQGSSDIDVLMAHMTPEPLPLSEAVLESPFAAAIRRATEKEPSARFANAAEMRAAIEAALQQWADASRPHPPAPAPQPPPQPEAPKRSHALPILGAIVILAGAGAGILAWQTRSGSDASKTASAEPRPSASIAATAVPSAPVTPSAPAPATPARASAAPEPRLSSAELNRRLVADGWTILPESTIDVRRGREVASSFVITKPPDLEGSVELHVYDQAKDAAARFKEVDGRLPADTRLGRDGRIILSVRVEGRPPSTSELIELLTAD